MSNENKNTEKDAPVIDETTTDEPVDESLASEQPEPVVEMPVSEAPVEENSEDEEADELSELKSQLDASEEKYLRLYAEFENYKKRTRAELETEKVYRSQRVLTDILPALDNIERALKIEGETEQFKSLHKGVEMVHESLLRSLKENGLEVIEAENASFNPNLHQAVMQESDPNQPSGIVLEELQKGYKLKDRVLRASMVKVNE